MNHSDEFVKFSFHNHFGGEDAERPVKSSRTYSFDLSLAQAVVDDAATNSYKLLGFTNHNIFKKNDFELVRDYGSAKDVLILPGVELDLVDDINLPNDSRKFLHTCLLFAPDVDLDDLETKIDKFIADNGENCITDKQLAELVFLGKCIVCPHGYKQKNRSASRNVSQFLEIMGMATLIPMFLEDCRAINKENLALKLRSYLSDFEFEYLKDYVASISCADRLNFSEIQEPAYLWGDKSFDSLFYAAIIGESRILRESDFNEKTAVVSKIKIINNGGPLQNLDLSFSEGMNAFIGPSGSGKTLLLNLLNYKLTGKNLSNPASSASVDYSELYKGSDIYLYDNSGNEINKNDFSVFEGESLYNQIISTYNTKNKSDLLDLFKITISFDGIIKTINYYNDAVDLYISKNKKKNSLKDNINALTGKLISLSDSISKNKEIGNDDYDFEFNSNLEQLMQNLGEEFKKVKQDAETYKDAKTKLLKLAETYKIQLDFEGIDKTLYTAITIKYYEILFKYYDCKSKNLITKQLIEIVKQYKKSLGAKNQLMFENKDELNKTCSSIVNLLQNYFLESPVAEVVPILDAAVLAYGIEESDLYENAKITNCTVSNSISYDNFVDSYSNSIGGGFKVNKSLFKNVFNQHEINLNDESKMVEFFKVFIENSDNGQQLIYSPTLKEIVDYDIEIKVSDKIGYQNIESLSAGQLSKIYIDVFMENNLRKYGPNTIILYDQPDNNLEKRFVLDTLANKFKELKLRYQIFITTHEPLLVINGDANKLIEAANIKTINDSGKIFYKNVTILESNNKKEAVDKVAALIDGSADALKIRSQLYGGMKK